MKKAKGVLSKVGDDDIRLLKSNPSKFWEGVTSLDQKAFCYCENLTEIHIPDGVTIIGNNAFLHCPNLAEVKLPSSLTSIGEYSFSDCLKLKSIKIPEGVTSVGRNAFSGCSNLSELKLSEGLKVIDGFAFYGCRKINEVKLPEGVTAIGDYAFCGCYNLSEIKLPESVEKLGNCVFHGCNDIAVYIKGTKIKNEFLITNFDNVLKSPKFYQKYLDNFVPQEFVDRLNDENKLDLLQTLKYYNKNVYCKYIKGNKELGGDFSHNDLATLCLNLGIFSSEKMSLGRGTDKEQEDLIANQGYNILQKLIKKVEAKHLHIHFQALNLDGPNPELIRFLSNKTSLDDILQEEESNPGFITRTISWFKARSVLQLSQDGTSGVPNSEENRYKVLVYETMPSGVDKLKWHEPTIENLKREFKSHKFIGVNPQNAEIAQELAKHDLYEQRHFDKACEINKERIDLGVSDHITQKPVRQTIDEAWKEYFEKTEQRRNEIVDAVAKTTNEQGEVADRLFTYEMISKSSPANFCMGFYTSCCATLYGVGSGAQRAMIISPNMQPLAIRDSRGEIVAFGIIYVNKKEGYAVVDDIEVNKKYDKRQGIREAIYNKAMAGVDAFVKQYNLEQASGDNASPKIKKVTCGISPNWIAINDFIKQNPESEILSAPNLGDFGYVGEAFRWPGDWHNKQYTIWQEDEEQ